jgi:hypothetical protein
LFGGFEGSAQCGCVCGIEEIGTGAEGEIMEIDLDGFVSDNRRDIEEGLFAYLEEIEVV